LQVINENFRVDTGHGQPKCTGDKKFEDNKNREFEKSQEKIKETIKTLYKHQNETKNTIN
jgi:hypothetical protein